MRACQGGAGGVGCRQRNKDSMSTIERISAAGAVRRVLSARTWFSLLLAASVFCGCVRYDMTLTNGAKVTNVPKPVRSKDGSYYTIKMNNGQTYIIPAGRVVNIAPHGDTNWMFRNQ